MNKSQQAILSISESEILRFHSLIEKRGPDVCWPWLGRKYHYPDFAIRVKAGLWVTVLPHRLAFYLANGYLPSRAEKREIMHHCNNENCLNPKHLLDGGHRQNLLYERRRRLVSLKKRGVKNSNAKLTEKQVREIYFHKGTKASIAAQFHVSYKTIQLIKTKRRWLHLTSAWSTAPSIPRGMRKFPE